VLLWRQEVADTDLKLYERLGRIYKRMIETKKKGKRR